MLPSCFSDTHTRTASKAPAPMRCLLSATTRPAAAAAVLGVGGERGGRDNEGQTQNRDRHSLTYTHTRTRQPQDLVVAYRLRNERTSLQRGGKNEEGKEEGGQQRDWQKEEEQWVWCRHKVWGATYTTPPPTTTSSNREPLTDFLASAVYLLSTVSFFCTKCQNCGYSNLS